MLRAFGKLISESFADVAIEGLLMRSVYCCNCSTPMALFIYCHAHAKCGASIHADKSIIEINDGKSKDQITIGSMYYDRRDVLR